MLSKAHAIWNVSIKKSTRLTFTPLSAPTWRGKAFHGRLNLERPSIEDTTAQSARLKTAKDERRMAKTAHRYLLQSSVFVNDDLDVCAATGPVLQMDTCTMLVHQTGSAPGGSCLNDWLASRGCILAPNDGGSWKSVKFPGRRTFELVLSLFSVTSFSVCFVRLLVPPLCESLSPRLRPLPLRF
jgi:hypothetical protein